MEENGHQYLPDWNLIYKIKSWIWKKRTYLHTWLIIIKMNEGNKFGFLTELNNIY